MICILTERRLKPGAWEEFRRAWEPPEPPSIPGRGYHVRDLEDPDHVISFGLFEADASRMAALRDDPKWTDMQRARQAAMAPFVESTGVDAVFEVIEVVEEPGARR